MSPLARGGLLLLLLAFLLCSSATAAPEDLEERQEEEGRGPPQNLTAEGVSESAINVSWSPPEERPEYYKLQCSTCTTMEDVAFDTHYIMEKLDPCEDYKFIVASHYNETFQPEASTAGSTLSSKPPPPYECESVHISYFLRVRWKSPATDCPLGNYSVTWSWEVMWGTEDQGSNFTLEAGTSFTVRDAVPYTRYTVTVAASTAAGYGPPCSLSADTLQAKAGPPVLTNLASGDRSLTVTWDPPHLENGIITKYGVFLEGESDPHTTVEGNTFTFVGLQPCQEYCVCVKAFNGAGYGDPSDVQCETVEYDALPEEMTCKVTDSHISACWSSPECPVTRYNVAWLGDVLWSGKQEEGNATVMWAHNPELCLNISVTPYSDYSVTLSVGERPETVNCSSTVPPAAPGPPSLKLLTEDLTINASWTEPEEKNGIIADYILEWTCPEDSSCSQAMGSNETLSYIIGDLSCGETYEVTVRAKTEDVDDEGEKSTPETAEIPDVSVAEMNCESDGPEQVSVEWQLQNPLCPFSGYILTWSFRVLWSTEEDTGGDEIPEGDDTYILYDLKPCTNVSVCARVKKSSGSGGCCSVITQEDEPSEPTDLKSVGKSCISISLQWSRPTEENGILTGWHLSWSSLNGEQDNSASLAETLQNYTIVGLSPSTMYNVCVKAVNKAGKGECAELAVSTSDNCGNSNIGVIVGASVGGVALVVLLTTGGFIFFRRSKKSEERENLYSKTSYGDSLPMQQFNGMDARTTGEVIKDSTPFSDGAGKDGRRFSLLPRLGEHNNQEDLGVPDLGKDGRRLSLQMAGQLQPKSEYGRRFSQQLDQIKPVVDNNARRLSLQPLSSRPSLGGTGRRLSQQSAYDMPSLEQSGRRSSIQSDFGRPMSEQYGRRSSTQSDLGRPMSEQYGRRSSMQSDLGRPSSEQYGRRSSTQSDLGRPMSEQYGRRSSMQSDRGRPSSEQYGRRLSQQADLGRPSLEQYGRRPSQQVPMQGNYVRRPSQQFTMGFPDIIES